RFAPTDFSQMIERPTLRPGYVPFYCVLLNTVSYYRAKVLFSEKEIAAALANPQSSAIPLPSSQPAASGGQGQGVWREISGTRESRQEKMICGGLMDPEEREVLAKIDGWDMETSVSLEDEVKAVLRSGATTTASTSKQGDSGCVDTFTLVEPSEVWRMVEEAV